MELFNFPFLMSIAFKIKSQLISVWPWDDLWLQYAEKLTARKILADLFKPF